MQQQQQQQEPNVDMAKKLEEMKQLLQQQMQQQQKQAQQQQQPQQQQKQEPKQDNVLRKLELMTPEERAAWAAEKGTAGVLKLLELQDRLYEKKMQEILQKAETSKHEALVEAWMAENEDIFKDEELAAIAEGIEQKLLKEAGYKSFKEMPIGELKKHLQTVATKVRDYGVKLGKLEETAAAFRSVGDAGTSPTPVASQLDQQILKMKGSDLEALSIQELEKLEQQLLQ